MSLTHYPPAPLGHTFALQAMNGPLPAELKFWENTANRPFTSSPGPLYHNEVKCLAFDEEMIFHSHANKTHFHQKGCSLDLNLKVKVLNSEVENVVHLYVDTI